MASYQKLEQEFVEDLFGARKPEATAVLRSAGAVGATAVQARQATAILPSLQTLVDALPYYGDPDFETAHRSALTNLLEVNMPNSAITPQPNEFGFGYSTMYSYTGPASGYRAFFFAGITQTASAANVARLVQTQNGNLNSGWWGNYGVAVLTDAVRRKVGLTLNTGKLAGDLSTFNTTFLPCLAASYLGVYQSGFTPTANALNAIVAAGQTTQACADLVSLISSGQFTANINEVISAGGDRTAAAVWFLFNLWTTLKALGLADVDSAIRQFQAAGLNVPAQVGPQNWQNGGYTTWYDALSGSDLAGPFSGPITAALPELKTTYFSQSPLPVKENVSLARGYAQSLCYWGALNWYNPPPSSCLGKGTGVLMADGSVRAIEDVRIGDTVRTLSGNKRVALVESPPRAGRTLYRVNGLNLYTTAAHPFMAAAGAGVARFTLEPWNLIDTAPTMAFDGVAALVPGSRLSGLGPGGPQEIAVERIEPLEAPSDDTSCVYDLILERSDRAAAPYCVGGPDIFLAVDAETSDGFRQPNATVAIVTAMQTAIESCRRRDLPNPTAELHQVVARLDIGQAVRSARAAAWTGSDSTPPRVYLPGLDFFLLDGKWDVHASMLENDLVRRFARMARRETATGWRSLNAATGVADTLTVVVHDIEFVMDAPRALDGPLSIEIRLRGWSAEEDTVRQLTVDDNGATHARLVDSVIDFGRIPRNAGPADLIGTISRNGEPIAAFRTAVLDQIAPTGMESFLFSGNGRVIGRIALEPRLAHGADAHIEQQRSAAWTHRNAFALAQSLGRQIGSSLALEFEQAMP